LEDHLQSKGYAAPRRPNPVFSDEYDAIRSVVIGCRLEAGMTQRALARELGRANSHVSMIERGQRRIDTLELYLIARALAVEPAELFRRISAKLSELQSIEL
jgi:transcriptional regulator with XRE-family HTH domain